MEIIEIMLIIMLIIMLMIMLIAITMTIRITITIEVWGTHFSEIIQPANRCLWYAGRKLPDVRPSYVYGFLAFADKPIRVLISNFGYAFIMVLCRSDWQLVTRRWILGVVWSLICRAIPVHFRINCLGGPSQTWWLHFKLSSLDLIIFWLSFTQFPSFPGLWMAKHLTLISRQTAVRI